eukprot:403344593
MPDGNEAYSDNSNVPHNPLRVFQMRQNQSLITYNHNIIINNSPPALTINEALDGASLQNIESNDQDPAASQSSQNLSVVNSDEERKSINASVDKKPRRNRETRLEKEQSRKSSALVNQQSISQNNIDDQQKPRSNMREGQDSSKFDYDSKEKYDQQINNNSKMITEITQKLKDLSVKSNSDIEEAIRIQENYHLEEVIKILQTSILNCSKLLEVKKPESVQQPSVSFQDNQKFQNSNNNTTTQNAHSNKDDGPNSQDRVNQIQESNMLETDQFQQVQQNLSQEKLPPLLDLSDSTQIMNSEFVTQCFHRVHDYQKHLKSKIEEIRKNKYEALLKQLSELESNQDVVKKSIEVALSYQNDAAVDHHFSQLKYLYLDENTKKQALLLLDMRLKSKIMIAAGDKGLKMPLKAWEDYQKGCSQKSINLRVEATLTFVIINIRQLYGKDYNDDYSVVYDQQAEIK